LPFNPATGNCPSRGFVHKSEPRKPKN
jgi:hypothetical protein